MKTWNVVATAIALGVILGVASIFVEFVVSYEASYRLTHTGNMAVESTPQEQHSRPKVVVEGGESHDFGVMDRRTKRLHTFVFRNEGNSPLLIKTKSTTCKCTVSQLEETKVPPGASTDVVLEWTPDGISEKFQQRAEIQTNDPLRPIVNLTIHGMVVETFRTVPSQILLRRFTSGRSYSFRIVVYTYREGGFKIVDYDFIDSKAADYINAEIDVEATAEELGDDSYATSAQAVNVTILPGLPLGPLNHRLLLKTDIEEVPVIEVPIVGTVVSDVSVVGSRFRSGSNRLRLGGIKAAEGVKHDLFIIVKGPHRDKIGLKVGAVDPHDVLQVEIGEPKKVNRGMVHKYPLTIEIPPGSRAVSRYGIPGSPPGEILIETDHPQIKQFTIYIEFAIQG